MIKGTIHKADTVNHYTPIKQTNIYKAETRRNMRKIPRYNVQQKQEKQVLQPRLIN